VEDGETFVQNYGLKAYSEICVKTGKNVKNLFGMLSYYLNGIMENSESTYKKIKKISDDLKRNEEKYVLYGNLNFQNKEME